MHRGLACDERQSGRGGQRGVGQGNQLPYAMHGVLRRSCRARSGNPGACRHDLGARLAPGGSVSLRENPPCHRSEPVRHHRRRRSQRRRPRRIPTRTTSGRIRIVAARAASEDGADQPPECRRRPNRRKRRPPSRADKPSPPPPPDVLEPPPQRPPSPAPPIAGRRRGPKSDARGEPRGIRLKRRRGGPTWSPAAVPPAGRIAIAPAAR